MAIGAPEGETFWTDFLHSLAHRGLHSVKFVISNAHEGIKAAMSRVFSATWQRCRVHFARNAMAHAGKSGRRVVPAFIATAYAQETPEAASGGWRKVADQLRPSAPKLARIAGHVAQDRMRTIRRVLELPALAEPKTIRHTVATIMLGRGVPPTEIEGLLGHAVFKRSSAVYAKYNSHYLGNAKRVLSEIFREVLDAAGKWSAVHLLSKTGNGRVVVVDRESAKAQRLKA